MIGEPCSVCGARPGEPCRDLETGEALPLRADLPHDCGGTVSVFHIGRITGGEPLVVTTSGPGVVREVPTWPVVGEA